VPARYLHTATVINDQLYVYGGFAKNTECTYVLSQMSVLDLTTFTWSKPYTVPPRYNHSATLAAHGKQLYIYAGKDESGKTVCDLFAIHLDTFKVMPQVTLTGDVAYLKSQHFTEYIGNNQLMVFGKYADTPDKDDYGLWLLDLESLEWRQLFKDKCFTLGVWNYFAVIQPDELVNVPYFPTEDDDDQDAVAHQEFCGLLNKEHLMFVFLGNMDKDRPQPYDHFRDLLVVDPEMIGLWQVPQSTMQSNLADLLESGRDWADFEIRSTYSEPADDPTPENKRYTLPMPSARPPSLAIKCHRAILWARWPHFRTMLSSGMRESHLDHLNIPEPPQIVAAFVHYLYTDQLAANTSCDILCGLLVLASIYFLPRLVKLCCQHLVDRCLSAKTCIIIFQSAVEANEVGLKSLALEYIFAHFGAVLKSKALMQLSDIAMEELLSAVSEDATLVAKDQYISANKGPIGIKRRIH
jgi:hypothetical protein